MTNWHVALEQLAAYGIFEWLFFIAVTLTCAYFLGVPGIIIAHVVVAAAVLVSDVMWVTNAMARSRTPGGPDLDMVFHFGVIVRILLVNSVLLPVAMLALWVRRSRRRRLAVGTNEAGPRVLDEPSAGDSKS